MSNRVSADGDHLLRLGRECRDAAAELRRRIDRFRDRTGPAEGAYGESPEAEAAAHESSETVRQMLEHLEPRDAPPPDAPLPDAQNRDAQNRDATARPAPE